MKLRLLTATAVFASLTCYSVCLPMLHGQVRQRPETKIHDKAFPEVIKKFRKSKHNLIAIEGGKLTLDLPGWGTGRENHPGRKFVMGLLVGSGGGGGNTEDWHFDSYDVNCHIRISQGRRMHRRRDGPLRKFFEIRELNYPYRLLEMRQVDNDVDLFYQDVKKGMLFWLIQREDAFQIAFVDGNECQVFTGDSIEALHTAGDLSPIVDRVSEAGVDLQRLGLNNRMMDLVRGVLEFDDNKLKSFRETWADIESADFEKRQQSAENLDKDFDRWAVAIAFALSHPGAVPVDFRINLNRMLKEKADAARKKGTSDFRIIVQQFVNGKIADDPKVLVRLLKTLTSDDSTETDSIAAVVRQLEKTTGESLGSDIKAWENWLASQSGTKRKIRRRRRGDSGGNWGNYGLARSLLSELANLKIGDDGNWTIHRDHWKSHFGVETVEELLERAERQFNETGLPASWLNIGRGVDRSLIGFPHLLFEKYELKVLGYQEFGSDLSAFFEGRAERTLNRELGRAERSFFAQLMMHPDQARNDEIKEEYFWLRVSDAVIGAHLQLYEHREQGLNLLLRNAQLNELLWLVQEKDGPCHLHHIKLGDHFSAAADDGKQMLEQNEAKFEEFVFPFFKEMAVNLSEENGGPLEITDVIPEDRQPRRLRRLRR